MSLVSPWQVHVYAGASEVSVVYKVDEFSIELFVCLPENYPLQPPTIREGKRARVDPTQWRKWMLQLNVFMANQVIATRCFYVAGFCVVPKWSVKLHTHTHVCTGNARDGLHTCIMNLRLRERVAST